MTTTTLVLDHLRTTPTIGLRELGRAVGRGRTATHRAVRKLVADGAIVVTQVGTCADQPSSYRVVDQ